LGIEFKFYDGTQNVSGARWAVTWRSDWGKLRPENMTGNQADGAEDSG